MAAEPAPDLSTLLIAWTKGDSVALGQLVSLVYPELRRIARKHLSIRGPGQSLESAALANEAYIKLLKVEGIRCEDRTHFFALCAQIIRRILVDHARQSRYKKRGGDAVRVPLDENIIRPSWIRRDVLDLDEALGALSKIDPRKARVVELRYFGGLTMDEIGQMLGVSAETSARDWKLAKSWLLRELSGKNAPPRDS